MVAVAAVENGENQDPDLLAVTGAAATDAQAVTMREVGVVEAAEATMTEDIVVTRCRLRQKG